MSTHNEHKNNAMSKPMNNNTPNDTASQAEPRAEPIVALPGDEQDVLISRIIDGVATSDDWVTFRAVAASDPTIWGELAQTQHAHETLTDRMEHLIGCADMVDLPGGLMCDRVMRSRTDLVARWGGWAAAAAILLVWGFGWSTNRSASESSSQVAGLIDVNNPIISGAKTFLEEAEPEQAFDQYMNSGQSSGQVVGEMPEKIVIETRAMPDGSIEVLYLRQIIERQIMDHAYREVRDDAGNVTPVPVRLSPNERPASVRY